MQDNHDRLRSQVLQLLLSGVGIFYVLSGIATGIGIYARWQSLQQERTLILPALALLAIQCACYLLVGTCYIAVCRVLRHAVFSSCVRKVLVCVLLIIAVSCFVRVVAVDGLSLIDLTSRDANSLPDEFKPLIVSQYAGHCLNIAAWGLQCGVSVALVMSKALRSE